MKSERMLFNVESDVAGYLGVLIDRQTDGTIIMRQSGLAKRIVEALHLDDASTTSSKTPCTSFLPLDVEGMSTLGTYNYASVVGMLSYLQGHSRIDISLAVSQVARYVHSPKQSHEQASSESVDILRDLSKKDLYCIQIIWIINSVLMCMLMHHSPVDGVPNLVQILIL
jgi:hypothetical protein